VEALAQTAEQELAAIESSLAAVSGSVGTAAPGTHSISVEVAALVSALMPVRDDLGAVQAQLAPTDRHLVSICGKLTQLLGHGCAP
jgi:hypothetical protein